MGEISLAVETRSDSDRGKGAARRLRAAGRIPAVVYGRGHGNVPVTLDPAELDNVIRTSHAGANTLIDLQGAPEVAGRTVLVKEIQREPVRGALMHVDLLEIDPDARLNVLVPVHLTGTSVGVTLGGVLDHALRAVELSCPGSSIPDEIVVDVTELEQGQSLHASDLQLPANAELLTQGEIPVVSVVAPRIEEEPTVEEGAEETEADAAGDAPKEEAAAEGDGDK